MAIGQSCMVRVSDLAGNTLARWSSHWVGRVVTWQSTTWQHQPMSWTIGDVDATLTLPRTGSLDGMTTLAAQQRHLVELVVYQFDEEAGETGPPAAMVVVSQFTGQVIGASRSYSSSGPGLTWRLGSVADGAFPPLRATSFLVGVPCVL